MQWHHDGLADVNIIIDISNSAHQAPEPTRAQGGGDVRGAAEAS